MSSWTLSAEAYRTALNCLPNDDGNATIADKALKNQFLDGLQKAENEKDNVNFKGKAVTPGELPWERAAGLKEEFARAQRFSSVGLHFKLPGANYGLYSSISGFCRSVCI